MLIESREDIFVVYPRCWCRGPSSPNPNATIVSGESGESFNMQRRFANPNGNGRLKLGTLRTADHGGYKFIAYVLTILPHILSLQNNSWCPHILTRRYSI